jgi:hypothetical protein
MINKVKRLLFLSFFLILQGCRENSYYEELKGKRFELLEDSFFLKWTSGHHDIDLPGKFSFHANVPFTIEDYLQYPNSWEKTENYIKAYGNLPYSKEQILGILKKGTTLRFVNIDKSYSWGYFETYLYPLVEIENGPYKGQISRINLIDLFSPDPPRISKYLKQID